MSHHSGLLYCQDVDKGRANRKDLCHSAVPGGDRMSEGHLAGHNMGLLWSWPSRVETATSLEDKATDLSSSFESTKGH